MEMADLFGWVKTLLTEIGVWTTLTAALRVVMVLIASAWVIKFLRG
jgi:hypothetical protein